MDKELGLVHVRLQTWAPFTCQVYANGHDYVARQPKKKGIAFAQADNAFAQLADAAAAQRCGDRFAKLPWPKILERYARQVNPLLHAELKGLSHYWVIDQAEYATDVCFVSKHALAGLLGRLLASALATFSPKKIFCCLGRKWHERFNGEVQTHYKSVREPGACTKHFMKRNWLKMYAKLGLLLRVETVINQPGEFKVLRDCRHRDGTTSLGWFAMCKGVGNLHHYQSHALACNQRDLAALAGVDDPTPGHDDLKKLTEPHRHQGRSYAGFNPAREAEVRLFAAVRAGDHIAQGFRNQDIRAALYAESAKEPPRQRHSAAVGRLLKRLQARGLAAKVPRSRRWRATDQGRRVMGDTLQTYRRYQTHAARVQQISTAETSPHLAGKVSGKTLWDHVLVDQGWGHRNIELGTRQRIEIENWIRRAENITGDRWSLTQAIALTGGDLRLGILAETSLTEEEARIIIRSAGREPWTADGNLSQEQLRRRNQFMARGILASRNPGTLEGVISLYRVCRDVNPAFFMFERGFQLASGREFMTGHEVSRVQAAVDVLTYLAILKGFSWAASTAAGGARAMSVGPHPTVPNATVFRFQGGGSVEIGPGWIRNAGELDAAFEAALAGRNVKLGMPEPTRPPSTPPPNPPPANPPPVPVEPRPLVTRGQLRSSPRGMGPRTGSLSRTTINDYKRQMLDGSLYADPRNKIAGYYDGQQLVVTDGHHRVQAAMELYEQTGNAYYLNELMRYSQRSYQLPSGIPGVGPLRLPGTLEGNAPPSGRTAGPFPPAAPQ